ncbi:MAG: hypothetical protein P8J20_13690 [Novosphingobium sp.]|nr:hypothetical protein [Novosphingobium sp.]
MARAAPILLVLGLVLAPWSAGASAREVVDASAPEALSVTLYRDPDRGVDDAMNRNWPRGFAMISETRVVTLPPGVSTVRFGGVAEGMVTVSAIVTGLPGGTIEKNRNADLLSPAALVDGTLGNRVTITRSNPATGQPSSESAIVRTRADGGLVLQTAGGFEAVRCSGLPEKLTFAGVPTGLSADPVFTIDTRDDSGGTYRVTLTYLAWGFDWQAHYVATLKDGRRGKVGMRLMSWLTMLNDNGQSFADTELLAVAGTLNVESNYQALSDPPKARPLRLTCYPIGSTARGSPVRPPLPPPAPMAAMGAMYKSESIIVTARRRDESMQDVPVALTELASEEALGDLKLYRVPERVTVSAKGLKQVAFLNKEDVEGEFIHTAPCEAYSVFDEDEADPAGILFATKNDEKHGLGASLPMGGFTIFEPSSAGDLLIGEQTIRDYAVGQDVEIPIGESTLVFAACARMANSDEPDAETGKWAQMRAVLSNAGRNNAKVRLDLGASAQWEVSGVKGTRVKDGRRILETTVRSGQRKEITFRLRRPPTKVE